MGLTIITTAVIKGGTGKTTTAAALAQAATKNRKRVLAIDLDPQANLTAALGADQNLPGAYQLLHEDDPASLIQKTEQGIDTISAAPDLATEQTKPASGWRLRNVLDSMKGYDLIIIDTPPFLGELTYNALLAATGLIIPIEADTFGLQGLYQITDIAHHLQNNGARVNIYGSVITRYDARSKISRFWYDAISEKGAENGAPLLGVIRPGVVVKEAQGLRQSLFDYAPKSKPAQDYMALYERIRRMRNK